MSSSIANAAEIWIDAAICTGCGACVEACPTGALTLVEGKARFDADRCQACKVCVQVCPTGALQPVLFPKPIDQSDLVPASTPPPEVRSGSGQMAPLRDAAIATVVATGIKLVQHGVQALARSLTHVLSSALESASSSSRTPPAVQSSSRVSGRATQGQRSGRGGGQQGRHRHRGRR
jgi:ferredoxin